MFEKKSIKLKKNLIIFFLTCNEKNEILNKTANYAFYVLLIHLYLQKIIIFYSSHKKIVFKNKFKKFMFHLIEKKKEMK